MNNILQNRLNQLINLQNFSCWYLVKHPTTFYKLCYLVSFLEKYQKEHCTEQFQKYISDNIAKLNEQKGLEISDNYRTLLVAAYFGLIQKIAAKGSTYEQSKITDTYYEMILLRDKLKKFISLQLLMINMKEFVQIINYTQ